MRAISAFCLACVACFAGACAGVPPSPCTPAVMAGVEADYAAKVIAACPDKATRNQCAAVPALRAERDKKETEAKCH